MKLLFRFLRFIASLFAGKKIVAVAEMPQPNAAAEAYYGRKKEPKPYNKTGVSFFFDNQKKKEVENKIARNQVRAKLQRQSRKVNFGLA